MRLAKKLHHRFQQFTGFSHERIHAMQTVGVSRCHVTLRDVRHNGAVVTIKNYADLTVLFELHSKLLSTGVGGLQTPIMALAVAKPV